MQMMGILLIFMHVISSITPPRSPPLMPSTSSMIRHIFLAFPVKKLTARLVTISRTALLALPATPSLTSLPDAPLVSDAFTSTTSKPSCFAMIVAALLLPTPGGPEIRTAFMGLSLPLSSGPLRWTSSQVVRNLRSSAIFAPLPMSCAGAAGLYLLTQRGVSSSPLAFLNGAGGGAVGAIDALGFGEGLGVGTGDFTGFTGVGFTSDLTATESSFFGSGSAAVAGFSPHAATMASNPSSSISVVLCSFALLYLDLPQSIPTSR
mmetsp:Transcript_4279/g.19436  ORF Transcript_4279/g.19436 Transcript_4279/m.19436 type:complete len:263 (-) Transcript_4279:660-1448(-)